MKLLFDFFPIIAFFAAFKLWDIYIATAVAIGASGLQVLWSWLRTRHVPGMQWATLGLVVVLGGATLLLRDELFIKWKPTVLNALFAVAFLVSAYIGPKTLVERVMGGAVRLPAAVWRRLNWSWVVFFAALAAANLYVAYSFDTATWVNFKLFGMLGATFAFVFVQALLISRHVQAEPAQNGAEGG